MMQRRTALKLFSFLPFVGDSIQATAQERRQASEGAAEYFRLAWWVTHDSQTPITVAVSWSDEPRERGDQAKLTESILRILKASTSKFEELFKCTETGRILFAMPLQGTAMLATIWLGGTAYLIKVLRFDDGRIDLVLKERSATFECLYDLGNDGTVRIITTDTRGFPGDVKRWQARVFVWSGDKFKLKKRCRFDDRLTS